MGIYLAGQGSTLEDISITGFVDGIVVENNSDGTAATGNAIINVSGASGMTNVVHICGNGNSLIQDCPVTSAVTNLSVLQVSTGGTSGTGGASYAIEDDNVPISSGSPTLVSDSQVAIYAIGESMNSGFSRFTTASQSVNVPAWLVGNGVASGSCTNKNGTLYSNVGTSGSATLYACVAGTWTGIM